MTQAIKADRDPGEKGFLGSFNLLIKRGQKPGYITFLLIISIMTGSSLGGLLYPSTLYPTDQLLESFLANDIINLLIGLPILAGSIWLTRRGRLVGLLLWPGALLYILYNYITYLVGTPPSIFSLSYLSLVVLCIYGLQNFVRGIDSESVMEQISRDVPEKSGWVLVAFGTLFIARTTGIILEAITNHVTLPSPEIGVLIADTTLSIPIIAGGTLLLRKRALGYASGLGLLFATSMLYIGLIMLLLIQPFITGESLALVDIVVLLAMGLIFFGPTGLYLKGVIQRS